jgi:hypothetical protein
MVLFNRGTVGRNVLYVEYAKAESEPRITVLARASGNLPD